MFFFVKNTRRNKKRDFYTVCKITLKKRISMKAYKVAFLLVIFLFPTNVRSEIKVSAVAGVSNYHINQSVTYQVEINYSTGLMFLQEPNHCLAQYYMLIHPRGSS